VNKFSHSQALKLAAFNNAAQALTEDLNIENLNIKDINTENNKNTLTNADITAQLIPENNQSQATVICREDAILCGTLWFDQVFYQVDQQIKIEWLKNDGDKIQANETICTITGNTRSLLTAERSALNLLQSLSGTATTTALYVKQLGNSKTKILDTRKTIPGLRIAQKYAVHCGGGANHRFGLYDALLIKENHIISAGSIKAAIETSRSNYPDHFLEIEVETLDELAQVIALALSEPNLAEPNLAERNLTERNLTERNLVNRVLLDNFTIDMIKQAVKAVNKLFEIEISGNITLETLPLLGQLNVDYLSTGAISKHLQAIDFSMRINT